MSAALEVQGISKAFRSVQVSRDITFSLPTGARHALIGPNGAGKTTLVGILCGLIAPNAGSVKLQGADITRMPPALRVKRGLVRTFQVTSLFAEMSVLENVFMAINEREQSSRRMFRPASAMRALREEAEAIVDQFAMGDDLHRRVGEIAYGRQRLVELALALALEPKVLLLDEPAAGVPTGEIDLLLGAIARLPPELAVLIIEHDMQVVRSVARTATVLVQGRIFMTGPLQQVMDAPEVHDVYLGASGVRRFKG